MTFNQAEASGALVMDVEGVIQPIEFGHVIPWLCKGFWQRLITGQYARNFMTSTQSKY